MELDNPIYLYLKQFEAQTKMLEKIIEQNNQIIKLIMEGFINAQEND